MIEGERSIVHKTSLLVGERETENLGVWKMGRDSDRINTERHKVVRCKLFKKRGRVFKCDRERTDQI